MIITLHFAVEGMRRSGDVRSPEDPAAVMGALAEAGLGSARFDDQRGIFTVELDPAMVSWQEVRQAVYRAGKRAGRIWLAVVMSP